MMKTIAISVMFFISVVLINGDVSANDDYLDISVREDSGLDIAASTLLSNDANPSAAIVSVSDASCAGIEAAVVLTGTTITFTPPPDFPDRTNHNQAVCGFTYTIDSPPSSFVVSGIRPLEGEDCGPDCVTADLPVLSYSKQVLATVEDVPVPLNISASSGDTDDSEQLIITIILSEGSITGEDGAPLPTSLASCLTPECSPLGETEWRITPDCDNPQPDINSIYFLNVPNRANRLIDGTCGLGSTPCSTGENISIQVSVTAIEEDVAGTNRTVNLNDVYGNPYMYVEVGERPDAPAVYVISPVYSMEGLYIPLDISVSLVDDDSSEILSGIFLSGFPDWFTLNKGTYMGEGTFWVNPADLPGLLIEPESYALNLDNNFTITISIGSYEIESLQYSSPPTCGYGTCDSETESCGNCPQDCGQCSGCGNGTLDAGETCITCPADYPGGACSLSSVESVKFDVVINGVADTPDLSVPGTLVTDEDVQVDISFSSALVDDDGSEDLAVEISDVPEGSAFSPAGTLVGTGTLRFTAAEIADLAFTPPANSDSDVVLTITALATEKTGQCGTLPGLGGAECSSDDDCTGVSCIFSTATKEDTITIEVDAVADTPFLSVENASGTAGSAIPINITSYLLDSDGSEVLSVTISGVQGSMSAGIDNLDGTWTLGAGDLAGLAFTPAPGVSGDVVMTVNAVASEDYAGNGVSLLSAETDETLVVTVNPVSSGTGENSDDDKGGCGFLMASNSSAMGGNMALHNTINLIANMSIPLIVVMLIRAGRRRKKKHG